MRREADFPGEPTTIGELMRTPQTTPTRDEAVLRYYADTFCELGAHHECCGKLNKDECSGCLARSVLASAPAPASGGVDAKTLRGIIARWETRREYLNTNPSAYDAFIAREIAGVSEPSLARSALSPAATPVSEGGGWLIRKGGYFYRPNKVGYTTRKSEAGRYTEAEAKAEAQIEPGMKAIRAEDWPDELASSPAGGDVVQTLIDKTEKLIEAADDMGWSCNSSSADQAIREAKDAVRAALSQSTSAGRVGDGS